MVPGIFRLSFVAFCVCAISTIPGQRISTLSWTVIISALLFVMLNSRFALNKFGMKMYLAQGWLIIGLMFYFFYHLRPFLFFVSTGMVLNLIAISSNSWLMPICPYKLSPHFSPRFPPLANSSGNKEILLIRGYRYIDENTRFRFLTDCLCFEKAGAVFSAGDVILWFGYFSYPAYLLWMWLIR